MRSLGNPGGLLPGERLLWSGGPGRVRVSPADAALSLYLLGGLALVAVITAHGFLRHLPALFVAMAVIAWGAGAIQAVAMLADLLVLRPAIRRRSAYQITDYRVVVTTGLWRRRTWSAYLDQIDEPAVTRHRDGTEDVLLRVSPGSGVLAKFTGRPREGPFGLGMPPEFPVLRSLVNAAQAQQSAAVARRRMLDGAVDAPSLAGLDAETPLPAAIGLGTGERVLWAGRPERVPWWFGRHDVYLSAFGLVWLVFVGLMGALVVTRGPAAFLVVLVPFASAGGLYPSVGRLVHRRVRIQRSTYVVTDQRVIAVWQIRGEPVVAQAHLRWLLPPVIHGETILTSLARTDGLPRQGGWKSLTWPAATIGPPGLVAIRDPQSVRDLICRAQLTMRATRPVADPSPN